MVSSALEQYCIQEDCFPYDRDGAITSIIKKETGKDVKFRQLSKVEQKQVCILVLYLESPKTKLVTSR